MIVIILTTIMFLFFPTGNEFPSCLYVLWTVARSPLHLTKKEPRTSSLLLSKQGLSMGYCKCLVSFGVMKCRGIESPILKIQGMQYRLCPFKILIFKTQNESGNESKIDDRQTNRQIVGPNDHWVCCVSELTVKTQVRIFLLCKTNSKLGSQ